MGMEDLVMIRLDVEGMRHQIVHAFTDHQLNLIKLVEEETKKHVAGVEHKVTKQIAETVDSLIRAEIERQIRRCVDDAVYAERKRINDITEKALKEILKR